MVVTGIYKDLPLRPMLTQNVTIVSALPSENHARMHQVKRKTINFFTIYRKLYAAYQQYKAATAQDGFLFDGNEQSLQALFLQRLQYLEQIKHSSNSRQEMQLLRGIKSLKHRPLVELFLYICSDFNPRVCSNWFDDNRTIIKRMRPIEEAAIQLYFTLPPVTRHSLSLCAEVCDIVMSAKQGYSLLPFLHKFVLFPDGVSTETCQSYSRIYSTFGRYNLRVLTNNTPQRHRAFLFLVNDEEGVGMGGVPVPYITSNSKALTRCQWLYWNLLFHYLQQFANPTINISGRCPNNLYELRRFMEEIEHPTALDVKYLQYTIVRYPLLQQLATLADIS